MERPVPGNPLEVLVSPSAYQEEIYNTENTKREASFWKSLGETGLPRKGQEVGEINKEQIT